MQTGVRSDENKVKLRPAYAAYVESGSDDDVRTAGALTVVEAHEARPPLRLALTDRSIAGGSFGVDECQLLEQTFRRSIVDKLPVVLVLDSGGARLTAGLAGLGAFRRMYRAALDARRAGVALVTLVERDCFGGASMLAMLCTARAAVQTARVGMSGPAIIEKLSGRHDLDASDRDAVRNLFGAQARIKAAALELVFEPPASRRKVIANLLSSSADGASLRARHERLWQRMVDAGVELPRATDFADAVMAFARGQFVGAAEIWQLADAVLATPANESLTIVVDCPGQAATRADEILVLSEYVAHLAECLRERSAAGNEIVIRIVGESAGGIYVALAAGASRVEAQPQAAIRVLPAAAVHVVLNSTTPEETLADALRNGCVDRVVPIDLPRAT